MIHLLFQIDRHIKNTLDITVKFPRMSTFNEELLLGV